MTTLYRLCFLLLLLPSLATAQSYGLGTGNSWVSEKETRRIEAWLQDSDAYCGDLKAEYRVDCLADQYEQIAKSLPRSGDYNRLRTILAQAARDLDAVVKKNAARNVASIRPKKKADAPRAFAKRDLRAVRKSQTANAARAAERSVQEAQTRLLRSSENSRRRKIPFTRVANAMDSNKRLFRAA